MGAPRARERTAEGTATADVAMADIAMCAAANVAKMGTARQKGAACAAMERAACAARESAAKAKGVARETKQGRSGNVAAKGRSKSFHGSVQIKSALRHRSE